MIRTELELTESLHVMVARHFKAASQSKSLIFSDTELAVIRSDREVPFQLRYCPALAKKPREAPKNQEQNKDKPKPDPFENPSSDLLITEIPRTNPSHILVLNKFPVIENHFILATKTSKPQTHLLEPDDLGIAHACLQAWSKDVAKDKSRRLFAFFNSGEHSGASQPHRHIQFLPVEDMASDLDGEWQLLLDRMTARTSSPLSLQSDPDLPFIHYATELLPGISAQDLHSKYVLLLRAAIYGAESPAADLNLDRTVCTDQSDEAAISYNLAMTTERMAIVPRRSETAEFSYGEQQPNSVAINGTILGGTLMVKDEQDWQTLKQRPSLLDSMLSTIGFPVSDQTKL